MEPKITTLEDVDGSIQGAVIESIEAGVNGLHINLEDGRIIVFPDAVVVAVVSPMKTIQ